MALHVIRNLRALNLTPLERRTLLILVAAALCGGMTQAVMVVLPELLLNALSATHTHIVLITLLWPMGQLVAAYWSAYLDGLPQKSGVLRVVALVGRMPLALGALFDTVTPILVCFLFLVLTAPAVLAAHHAIVHTNYRSSVRGKLYSLTVATTILSSLICALIYGIILDGNPQAYRFILLLAAAAGAAEALIIAQVTIQTPFRAVVERAQRLRRSLADRVVQPWVEFVRVFRNDPEFFRFERNFFVYGFGFMIMQPFIPIFLAQDLGLNYTQIALAKSVILQIGMILMTPLTGQLFDRKNPALFGSYVFVMIALFPALMAMTGLMRPDNPQWMIYASYALMSIGWSGLTLLWNLGSMFFAQERDVSRYSGAHVVMVGLRGTIALVLGIFLVEHIPPVAAFILTAILWLSASLLMFRHWHQRYRNQPDAPELPSPPLPPPAV